MLVTLGEAGIKTRDQLAEYAGYELSDPADGLLRSHKISEDDANAIITAARAHWFAGEEKPAAETAPTAE
jgi:N utilization substance protein A